MDKFDTSLLIEMFVLFTLSASFQNRMFFMHEKSEVCILDELLYGWCEYLISQAVCVTLKVFHFSKF